ncbi:MULTISPECIES: discoidin domain-containing protein [unclassified Crossiella]|uniref:discoidin domain-containing protein n=1 Tax=unclassified Crossiella TaxID=2620835 RepID=UPI001FFE88F8|nr:MULTISPECIES: discoidin domain-containing protein [unclassified Crossiella]MCK2241951.1 discoidin domain-containing protein [Crossiella sp. S99.2]MCK2255854.1 discoidin domain-containing protein [Crossiella sp. S99.1]
MPRRIAALVLTLCTGLGLTTLPGHAAPPAGPYPSVGAGTRFLDQDRLLGDLPEPGWFKANIPFVDLPDAQVREIYYYRWKVYQEALKYTGPREGWIVSEFLGPVGYSAPSGGIVAAAGHHVYEGRWLRDTRYLDDYLRYWLRGNGAGPKPATEFLNKNTTDWAHQYSSWLADATVARAEITGDWRFATDLLPELRRHWDRWSPQLDTSTGLYWQTPVWDAMEYTASSYQSPDPYHGGDGFRPTLNTYQIADARAIAALSRRTGDHTTAAYFTQRAKDLSDAQQKWLWDPQSAFYKHVMRDNNPAHLKIADREQIGFVPWAFRTAPAGNAAAWSQLTDPQGFDAPYGPPTVERRSPWFMHEADKGCCRWDGPSWPYATSQTLTALANLLIEYPPQSYVDKDDYYTALRRYAQTQYKNGRPHVAEAHHPDRPQWMYDTPGHSQDYNHSTYTDLVLSGLLGIRPQPDASVLIHPLTPKSWTHFAVENLPYRGRNLTVLWDQDGTKYKQGKGFRVYLDGKPVATRPTPGPLRIPVPDGPRHPLLHQIDDAANPSTQGFPQATASYANPGDAPSKANDGQNFFLDVPGTRWTTYRSPNPEDWLALDFGRPTPTSDVRLYFYDDRGGVQPPASFSLQHKRSDGTWAEIPGQRRSHATPVGNDLTRITFPTLDTTALRVVAKPKPGTAFGLTAFQSWRTP